MTSPWFSVDYLISYEQLDSVWPSEPMWRVTSGSTLTQAMTCCQMVPSYYLNQCWRLVSKVQWIQMRAICQQILQPSTTEISLIICCLRFHSNLPGANKLMHSSSLTYWQSAHIDSGNVEKTNRGAGESAFHGSPDTMKHSGLFHIR